MDTSGYGGKLLVKRISVETSDPLTPKLYLEVKGMVELVARVEPQSVTFRGSAKENMVQMVAITPSEKYPFKLKSVSTNSEAFVSARLIPPDEGKNTWHVEVENRMKEPGRYFELLKVTTDSELKPEIKIRVYAMLHGGEPEKTDSSSVN